MQVVQYSSKFLKGGFRIWLEVIKNTHGAEIKKEK